jgi:hypothetical protein
MSWGNSEKVVTDAETFFWGTRLIYFILSVIRALIITVVQGFFRLGPGRRVFLPVGDMIKITLNLECSNDGFSSVVSLNIFSAVIARRPIKSPQRDCRE